MKHPKTLILVGLAIVALPILSMGGLKVWLDRSPLVVLIKEAKNKHPTAFKLWARGIKPRVQTMSDGTIHLFANGKLATINAARKKK